MSLRPVVVTHELLCLDLVTLDVDSEASESALARVHTCIWKVSQYQKLKPELVRLGGHEGETVPNSELCSGGS